MEDYLSIKSKIIRFSIIYTIFFILFTSCEDERVNIIPYVYVNTTIDMQNPVYIDLLNVGGSSYINYEGYNGNGIIVYHSGIDEYKAYDRTCTFQVQNSCAIETNENSFITAICPCCESEFELSYGTVSKGPAFAPLKEYRTSFDGSILHIYN